MHAIHLPDLIGKTQDDPLLQQFIQQYGLVNYWLTDEAKQDWESRYPDETYEIPDFMPEHYVLDPENFIVELLTQPTGANTPRTIASVSLRAGNPCTLPYGLSFDHDVSAFSVGELTEQSRHTVDNTVHCAKSFWQDGLCIDIVYREPEHRLQFLRISPVDEKQLAQRRFHASIKTQKRNIVDTVDHILGDWANDNPVHRWRERMHDGDATFDENNLALADAEIAAFIEKIRLAVGKKSPTQIVNALKDCVKRLNRLSRKHGHFIETSEREELVPYLNAIVSATGLQFEEGFDPTFEWREW
jgi:hypothetical protein